VGDAAILMGEIRALKEAFGESVEIEVSDQEPTVARRLYPGVRFAGGLNARRATGQRWQKSPVMQSIRWRRTWLAVRMLRQAPALARMLFSTRQLEHLARIERSDLVVATGGTYFVDHYNFSEKANELLAAQAYGKPTWLFTQSMGPFRRASSRALMRRIVAGSRGVFLRDERSREHLLEAGADAAKLSVHADAAFALVEPGRGAGARVGGAATVAATAPARARIAISVRSWAHARDDAESRYRRAVSDAARALARAGHEVVFLSTCQGVPEYWTDDSRHARGLLDELLADEPSVQVDEHFRTPAELAEHLRGFDVAIATRMHFAILALSVATPVVAIAYEFKSRELLRGLAMEEFVTDFEDVSGEWLVARTTEVIARGPALRGTIATMANTLRADAMRPAQMIRDAMLASALGATPASARDGGP
jgi:colanic acid/amylovoran biosynthesis protein